MEGIKNLSKLVTAFSADGVRDRERWHEWKNDRSDVLSALLEYEPLEDMPKVTQIVAPHFHDTLPLVGLNYTPAAGLSLHHYAQGWPLPLRLCRGIVFDIFGQLVAYPFPKFFNYGDPVEGQIPVGNPEVTVKEDGHLIIIFRYEDYIVMTTRGSFASKTAHLANDILGDLADHWLEMDLQNITLCAELIHPETKVGVDYGNRQALIALGVFENESGTDLNHAELCKAADALGIEAVRKVDMTISDLVKVTVDGGNEREGFVARWPNGHRVKFKYAGYLKRTKEERAQSRLENEPVAKRIDRSRRDKSVRKGPAYLRRPA